MKKQKKTRQVLKCSSSKDLLAVLPVLMGYTVEESLVVVLFKNRAATSVIRLDLPKPGSDYETLGIEKVIVDVLKKLEGINGVAFVVYSDAPFKNSYAMPHQLFIHWLKGKILESGFEVIDSLCVGSENWGTYRLPFQEQKLSPVRDLTANAPGLEARMMMQEPLEKLSRLGVLPEATESLSKILERFFLNYEHVKKDSVSFADIEKTIFNAAILFEGGFDESSLDEAISLLRDLSTPSLWVATAAVIAMGKEDALDIFCSAESVAPPNNSFSDLLVFISAEKIPKARLFQSVNVAAAIAANCPATLREDLIALISWCWWMDGKVTPAIKMFQALPNIPRHDSTAGIVKHLITDGPPKWVFKSSAGSIA